MNRQTYNQLEADAELDLLYSTMLTREAAQKKAAIDEAIDEVMRVFREHGIKAAGDDRCEVLVEAIARYAVSSDENTFFTLRHHYGN